MVESLPRVYKALGVTLSTAWELFVSLLGDYRAGIHRQGQQTDGAQPHESLIGLELLTHSLHFNAVFVCMLGPQEWIKAKIILKSSCSHFSQIFSLY